MSRLLGQRSKLAAAAIAGALFFSPVLAHAQETVVPTPSNSPSAASSPSASQSSPAATATTSVSAKSAFDDYASANPKIGKPKGAEQKVKGGSIRVYENETLTMRTGEKVIPVLGSVRYMWETNGGHALLGLPVTGEIDARGGVYQVFENATITWHPDGSAAVIANGIRSVWLENGGVSGQFGLALTNEEPTAGGVVQRFQGGAISWSAAGSRTISGGVHTLWSAAGNLGAAMSSEEQLGAGIVQKFVNGAITWHPELGAWQISGGINAMWLNNQWLGVARSPEYSLEGGAVQFFEHGAIAWHPRFGAYTVGGAIATQWLDGWHIYGMGYPTSPEIQLGEGAYQKFERGMLTWNLASIYPVEGAIGSYWNSQGGAAGRFGPATGPEVCIKHSCTQQFANGAITWNAATGARPEVLDRRCWYGRVACADKSTNQLYWVVDGRIIRTMDARFGRPGYDTSEGEFPVLRKIRMDWSVPFSGWMPFSIYFTNLGEAIHYSSGFDEHGHPSLGSHGCINMASWDDAEWLFEQMQSSDRIVVYRS